MDKGLFFLIMGLACFWLILDEFSGKKRISRIANFMTSDFLKPPPKYTEEETDKINEDAKDVNKKIPTPKLGGF